MDIQDTRGLHRKEIAKKNRAAIYNYIMEHPGCSRSEIARAVGLSYKTIRSHIDAIDSGWRPGDA